jgi:hypothetical protein
MGGVRAYKYLIEISLSLNIKIDFLPWPDILCPVAKLAVLMESSILQETLKLPLLTANQQSKFVRYAPPRHSRVGETSQSCLL